LPHPDPTLNVMEHRFALAKYGKQLWTRERAKEIRPDLSAIFDKAQVGDVIVIDAGAVEVFDFSFANELFGKTLLSLPHEYPGRFLVVEHLTKYAGENLSKALESMGLVIIERNGSGKNRLLGKVHGIDETTFAVIARKRGSVTASELKDELGINLTAVNERLTKLTNLGLVRREKGTSQAGREQYEYRALS
jgi:predicted transcriptional regulator